MADNDSLSSSSSDDDFLTIGDDGRSQDREALIRKKLMESFYGKTAPETTDEQGITEEPEQIESQMARQDQELERKPSITRSESTGQKQAPMVAHEASDDLDSPYFDSDAHTSRHVLRSNVHTLLEMEEKLALQVRTLDSTMQTLVYENYSKFIDATDAIRSIGVSVSANEEGLARLSKGMKQIDEQSKEVEDALGSLRDAVAEKLRVKRLLTRLDSLLKLPSTLKQQVGAGTYRLATKSYFSAHAILSKHSAGFESLKTIELDCHAILADMVKKLKRKLLFWSGNSSSNYLVSMDNDDGLFGDDDDAEAVREKAVNLSQQEEDEEWTPQEPPQTVSDIFECAGTLLIVLPKEDGISDGITFDSGLTPSECKSMALAAAIRFLDRVLDTHQVELQDDMFGASGYMDDTFDGSAMLDGSMKERSSSSKGTNLIPTAFLDNVLEAATLFGVSFSLDGKPLLEKDDQQLLNNFVADAYGSFLTHVKSLLLEKSAKVDGDNDDEDNGSENMDDVVEDPYSEVSVAMKQLLQAVRELASGLALPDVGVSADFASSLVEQAVEVTETMARRRVAEKFVDLRVRVIKECFAPFVKDGLAHQVNSDEPNPAPRVVEIVQIASVALSDGMQLVDDTIRSILTGGAVVADLKGVDFSMVKDAVQRCCRGFALWLASSLEVLGGCDSPSLKLTIEAEAAEVFEEAELDPKSPASVVVNPGSDALSEVSRQDTVTQEKIDEILDELVGKIQEADPIASAELVLAMSEMCRVAQRTVMESILQSISASEGTGRKKKVASDLFQSGSSKQKTLSEQDKNVSDRFILAGSRILIQYAMNLGLSGAKLICGSLDEVADQDGEELPEGPRPEILKLLESAKRTSLDSANVFGGDNRAGPVPEPPEDEAETLNTGATPLRSTMGQGNLAIKGLQLDVERMFTEKVPAYPHPTKVLEFTRNNVVSIMLKISFNALIEKSRSVAFRSGGFRQLHVDVQFLRYILPHYSKDDVSAEGVNSLTILDNFLNEVKTNAGNRSKDIDSINQVSFYNPSTGETVTIQSIIRNFMKVDEGEEGVAKKDLLGRFLITE